MCTQFLILSAPTTYLVFPPWSRTAFSCPSPSELCKDTPIWLLGYVTETPPIDPSKMQLKSYSSGVAKAVLCFHKSLMHFSQPLSVQKWRGNPLSSIRIGSITLTSTLKLYLCLFVDPFLWSSNMNLQRAALRENAEWQSPWLKEGGHMLTYKF